MHQGKEAASARQGLHYMLEHACLLRAQGEVGQVLVSLSPQQSMTCQAPSHLALRRSSRSLWRWQTSKHTVAAADPELLQGYKALQLRYHFATAVQSICIYVVCSSHRVQLEEQRATPSGSTPYLCCIMKRGPIRS